MRPFRSLATWLPALALLLAADSAASSAARRATRIRIDKSEHRLELLRGEEVLRTYAVSLGSGGPGPKRFEGDRTTPVGDYRVTGRFRGSFHRFLGISYPNAADLARHAELRRRGEIPPGRGPGHGVGIHGVGSPELAGVHKEADWTHGCIALDDDEIDELASLVPDGTPVEIRD